MANISQPATNETLAAAESSPKTRRLHREVLLTGALLVFAFGVAYLPVILTLREQWATNDTYSFGVLVPFISAYLIWTRRERLRGLSVAPRLSIGSIVVLAAAGLLLVGRLIAIVALQELSLLVMIFGLVLLLLGTRFFRELWFPLSYLLLMLPIWEFVTDGLHYQSQLLSASVGKYVLQTIGIPVFGDQIYLHLPNITLEVASACSGVNFLIAVIAVGIPQAYLYLQGWAPRAAVMVFAMAIALLSNGLRVAIIGALSYYKLSASIHGPGHILQGLFVSSFGFIALLAGVGLLAKRFPRRPESVRQEPRRALSYAERWRLASAALGAALVLVTTAVFQPRYSVDAATPAADNVVSLGDGWRQLPGRVPARFVEAGPNEKLTARVFQAPTGERVELFVGSVVQSSVQGSVKYRGISTLR